MANEELVQRIKQIITLAKGGDLDASYKAYGELFESSDFGAYRPEDQRQALKLMVHAKSTPAQKTPAMLDAHRSAVGPLTALVSEHGDPADHEMLGMCHERLGNTESAATIYRAGLALERAKNPQSDLCGALMKRVSLI